MLCVQCYFSRNMNNYVLILNREPRRDRHKFTTKAQLGGEKMSEEQCLHLSQLCLIGCLLIFFALGIIFHHLTIIIISHYSLGDESREYLDMQWMSNYNF